MTDRYQEDTHARTGDTSSTMLRVKVMSDGCGHWIASCGHQGGKDQQPVYFSCTCLCGRSYRVSCTDSSCSGRDFY